MIKASCIVANPTSTIQELVKANIKLRHTFDILNSQNQFFVTQEVIHNGNFFYESKLKNQTIHATF
jgi:hypothetical protein